MLLQNLLAISDPRRKQGQRYSLHHVVLFSIFGVLCGATSYRKIRRFIRAHRERLNELFGLDWERAPAHTTIRDMVLALDAKSVEQAFRDHGQGLAGPNGDQVEGRCVAVDGKVLRGSFDRLEDRRAAQVLSAFCHDGQIILAHEVISTKSNEIPAAQRLIQELGLKGCIYTLDALHCQKKTFDVAREVGCDLVVQVKDNQPTLLQAVREGCRSGVPFDEHRQADHGRNRIERREVKVFDAKPLLGEEGLWHETLACVVQVHRRTDKFNTREGQWVPSEETAYYVSTCRRDAESLAVAIRGHWGVENRNHYVRDVAMKEDASRIRRNPTIFARLRSFALNILRKNQIVNVSEALYDNALNLDNVLQYEGVL